MGVCARGGENCRPPVRVVFRGRRRRRRPQQRGSRAQEQHRASTLLQRRERPGRRRGRPGAHGVLAAESPVTERALSRGRALQAGKGVDTHQPADVLCETQAASTSSSRDPGTLRRLRAAAQLLAGRPMRATRGSGGCRACACAGVATAAIVFCSRAAWRAARRPKMGAAMKRRLLLCGTHGARGDRL